MCVDFSAFCWSIDTSLVWNTLRNGVYTMSYFEKLFTTSLPMCAISASDDGLFVISTEQLLPHQHRTSNLTDSTNNESPAQETLGQSQRMGLHQKPPACLQRRISSGRTHQRRQSLRMGSDAITLMLLLPAESSDRTAGKFRTTAAKSESKLCLLHKIAGFARRQLAPENAVSICAARP